MSDSRRPHVQFHAPRDPRPAPYTEPWRVGQLMLALAALAFVGACVLSGCSSTQPIAHKPSAATFDRATFLRSFAAEWSSIVDTITEDEALAILDSNGDGQASYAEIHVGQVLLRNIVCAHLGMPTGNTADDYRQHMAVKLSWDAAEAEPEGNQ